MRQILYVSAARPDLSPADTDAILARARKRNAELGVTGLLLEIDHSFLQLLEGDTAVLDQLMADITADRRHSSVMRLLDREVSRRQFPDWSMGFHRPASESAMPDAFRITRAALAQRLDAAKHDDPARLIDVFCGINERGLGEAWAA